MNTFGGPAFFIDRSDINTDEIIPAKYLTEISKKALKPHLLEDLRLENSDFDPRSPALQKATVLVTRSNFGCGSSREHAVWALEVNDINVVIADSFARIFRQNMFNCGILALEAAPEDIEKMFNLKGEVEIQVDLDNGRVTAQSRETGERVESSFTMNPFDLKLVRAGGWLAYADQQYS